MEKEPQIVWLFSFEDLDQALSNKEHKHKGPNPKFSPKMAVTNEIKIWIWNSNGLITVWKLEENEPLNNGDEESDECIGPKPSDSLSVDILVVLSSVLDEKKNDDPDSDE